MRGIPEDKAVEIGEQIDSCKYLECSVKEWLRDECQELQEPWMTLDEFLKSGFEGECWTFTDYGAIERAYHSARGFKGGNTSWSNSCITYVMPIHKPEPPQDD